MKPLRKHVALAVDGGGIRGLVVTRALALLEEHLGQQVSSLFHLAVGTSTGAIISAGLAAGLSAAKMTDLYLQLGQQVFRRTLRSRLWPLVRYRYPLAPLYTALSQHLGSGTMKELAGQPGTPLLVIPVFDLQENRSRLVKSYKSEYAAWPLAQAALASSAVPTFFPVVGGRYVDGGVGSYANPCYLAAYETFFCQGWDPAETSLISLGTGRAPHASKEVNYDRYYAWQWLDPLLGAFLQSADDQQVHLVQTFFGALDFRRFQVDLEVPIGMDDASQMDRLVDYGEQLGHKILNDELDPAQWSPRRLLPRHPSQDAPTPLGLGLGMLGAYLVARHVTPTGEKPDGTTPEYPGA
ncbi:MAG: patatin-like phospholipase family protein [Anaerolineae bacterium]